MHRLSFIASLILIAFTVALVASDTPVVSPDMERIILRLQRDTVIKQSRAAEIVREYERLQSEIKVAGQSLETLFKSLEKPGYKLDPESLIYTPLDPKKSD